MDRPIIFSGPMVRALIDGRKTQTRRLLKPQPEVFDTDEGPSPVVAVHVDGEAVPRVATGRVLTRQKLRYAVGDRLYVRESHQFRGADYGDSDGEIEWFRCYSSYGAGDSWDPEFPGDWRPTKHAGVKELVASDEQEDGARGFATKLLPSIHMPRWGSRITLTVTDVRVEPLCRISEADAIAEGVRPIPGSDGPNFFTVTAPGWSISAPTAAKTFRLLWEWLHTKPGERWEDNPIVVALTFSVGLHNIDQDPRP